MADGIDTFEVIREQGATLPPTSAAAWAGWLVASRAEEAPLLGSEIPDLSPEGKIGHFGAIPDAGDFQVTPAEEKDEPRIVAVPEFR